MANRIDIDYFEGFRNIPNLDKEEISTALETAIDRLEPRFFEEVFGYEFQKLMLASPTDPIYEPILNGVEFTNAYGELKKWEGINNSIANYIYFYFVKENYTILTGTGYIVGNNENSFKGNPAAHMSLVWNFINDALCVLTEYLQVNITVYPTLIFNNKKKLNELGI